MSRSRRYTPIIGVGGAASEKSEKRQWHQRWRAKQRAQIANYTEARDLIPVDFREVSNPWSMAKDGKSRLFRVKPISGSSRAGDSNPSLQITPYAVDENRMPVRLWKKLMGK